MGKLWGSSSPSNGGGATSNGHRPIPSPQPERERERRERMRGEEPDEHTLLLPPRRYLDPDDAAVSPYNLWFVRSLRWISIVLFVLSAMWWLLLLVATFITPPGFDTRGGGWFGFAYSMLATGILLVLLLFYATPSKTERIVLGLVFFFLFVNIIIILAAYPLRHDENWTGIVSAIWALLVTAWAIMCDRVVEYGKREEEVRLTGRRETRHSFQEWCSVFAGTILLIVFLVISILFTANLSIRARDATLAAPGRLILVDEGKYHVHLRCVGNKTSPTGTKITTVFIEGGEDPVQNRMERWVADAYANSAIHRYCYWDRPGMAWSENAPSPFSAGTAADTLSEALRKADESGPWVLVSHGVGGVYSRVFASRHTAEVHGLLLIDALPDSQLEDLGSASRGLLLWVRGIIYPLGLDRLVSTVFLGHGRADRVHGRSAHQNGGQIKAKLQENLVATTFTTNELGAANAILPREMPVVVVSSGKHIKRSKEWFEGQKELGRDRNLVAWDVVDGAGHDVWRDSEGRRVLEKRLAQLVNRGGK